jgi:hypothetical protein
MNGGSVQRSAISDQPKTEKQDAQTEHFSVSCSALTAES